MSPMMELVGHNGCVNRLDWNESGSLLASASDDTTVKIWRPFEYYYRHHAPSESADDESQSPSLCPKLVCNIQTDHIHNLFGVRFIPGTSDRLLCTGSMDKLVQIQSVDRQRTLKTWRIHNDRVKDVQITPRQPFVFYSVSEDGTIRRFDIRCHYKQFLSSSPSSTSSQNIDALSTKSNGLSNGSTRGSNGAPDTKMKRLFRRAANHISSNLQNLNERFHSNQNGNVVIRLDADKPEKSLKQTSSASTGGSGSGSSRTSRSSSPCSTPSVHPVTSVNAVISNLTQLRALRVSAVSGRSQREQHRDGHREDEDQNESNPNEHSDSDRGDPEDGLHAQREDDDYYAVNHLVEEGGSSQRGLLKGLSIHPLREYEFAVASGDQYVRVFDVRRGDHLTWRDTMVWVTPPHLDVSNGVYRRNRDRQFGDKLKVSMNNVHTTFVEYSSDGGQIVVTYHGENVYVFNTTNYQHCTPMHWKLNHLNHDDDDQKGQGMDYGVELIHRDLVDEVDRLKERGNGWFRKKEFSRAIECYYAAIHRLEGAQRMTMRKEDLDRIPVHALYCNVALCLIQRLHFNDLLMALFYCDKAIESKGDYKKAYFWKIKISMKIGDDALAMATADKAHGLLPDNADIQTLYRAVQRKKAQKVKKMKKEAKKEENES